MTYLIGIDGGGTSCKAALADATGRELARAEAGPANVNTDIEGSVSNIVAASRTVLAAAGLADVPLGVVSAHLGLAGLGPDVDTDALAARLPFARCAFAEDSVIALQGALGDGDGILAMLGTGSAFLARRGETVHRIGGWGFVLGDQGSGAWLGRALLEQTLLAQDGLHPHSALTRQMLERFGGTPDGLVAFARDARPADYARLAPLVFEHADRDAVAGALVARGAAHVTAALAALAWPGCQRIALLGGLAGEYEQRIGRHFRALLIRPETDALGGALQLAARRFGFGAEALRG